MRGRTQAALYTSLDLELSWSEDVLPQVERTKHVHSLHPYLGKFIPQLVDVFLRRYFTRGQCLYDPFAGSGTALVEANAFGMDAVGCDISAFNCLLCEVKTDHYALATLEMSLRGALEAARQMRGVRHKHGTRWLRKWYAKRAEYHPATKTWELRGGKTVHFDTEGNIQKEDLWLTGGINLEGWSETPWRCCMPFTRCSASTPATSPTWMLSRAGQSNAPSFGSWLSSKPASPGRFWWTPAPISPGARLSSSPAGRARW